MLLTDSCPAAFTANFSMPEIGDVFQEVFFVEAKPPEANEIAAAQAEAVMTTLFSSCSKMYQGIRITQLICETSAGTELSYLDSISLAFHVSQH